MADYPPRSSEPTQLIRTHEHNSLAIWPAPPAAGSQAGLSWETAVAGSAYTVAKGGEKRVTTGSSVKAAVGEEKVRFD